MAALEADELYLQHVSASDDLPEDDYVAQLPVVRHLMESGGLTLRSPTQQVPWA